MKERLLIFLLLMGVTIFISQQAPAQCSICSRTAQQLGEKPAKGMNAGIIYLALAPFVIVGYISYRWRKNDKQS